MSFHGTASRWQFRLILSAVWIIFVSCSQAGDWPNYRGPTHDGVIHERLNTQWAGSATNPIWLTFLTNGLTSLTISDGRVFTQVAGGPDGDGYPTKEFCIALNATNGDWLWSTEVESQDYFIYQNGGVGSTDDGPRSTPVCAEDSLFVLTSYHKLHRLNPADGSILWTTNLVAGFGGDVIPWQSAASPVVENGLVYVAANSSSSSLMAFHTSDGTLAWRSQNEHMTHSTPAMATISGVRQIIFATQKGLVSLDPQTGSRLWQTNYPFNYSTSLAASPVVWSNIVFVTASYGMGSAAFEIGYTNGSFIPRRLWSNTGGNYQSHWTSAVCADGALFCPFIPDSASAQLRCIDLKSGNTYWSANNFGRGSVSLLGTNLLVVTERGDLVLVAAVKDGFNELGRFNAIPYFHTDTNKCWNALAVSDGQVYVRSTAYVARYDLSVPDLALDELGLDGTTGKLQFKVRTVNGAPLDEMRAAGIELGTSTNASLPPALWPKVTNELLVSDGLVTVSNLPTDAPQRFYILRENP